jgi:hypothetical protein
MIISSGMGHGMSEAAGLVQLLYFSYGEAFFLFLPIFQYAAYFYVAYYKLHRACIWLATAHYLIAALLIGHTLVTRSLELSDIRNDRKFSLGETVINIVWFVFLNFLFFKRAGAGKDQPEVK